MQKLAVNDLTTKLSFSLCLYLSRNAGEKEDSVVQSEILIPVQASPDLIMAQTIKFTFVLKIFSLEEKPEKAVERIFCRKILCLTL
jgi:hypothetical protein